MAVTPKLYSKVFESAFEEMVNLLADTIKVLATTSGYTPDQDAHRYKDVSISSEVSGTGYTAGGATLANDTFNYTAGSNLYTYDGDNTVWDAAGGALTVRTIVVYDDTPASNKPLIVYQQSDADVTATSTTLTVSWNASGIFTITVG